MKQMALVVNNLIRDVSHLRHELYSVEFALQEFITYKKDDIKFQKHFKKAVDEKRKELDKDRVSDNLSNDK